MEPERPPIPHRAAQDSAQDVIAVRIARLDAVGDGKTQRSNVVGDDPEGHVHLLLLGVSGAALLWQRGTVFLAAELFDLVEDRAENVCLVVGDFRVLKIREPSCSLNNRSHPFKAHTRINVLRWQRGKGTVRIGVILDEDVVPDLNASGVGPVD